MATNKEIEELKEKKRLINLQLETYNKGKQKDEDDIQYALTEKALAMAEKMAATKGVKDIASSPIVSSVMKQNSKSSSPKKEKKSRLKRDPQFSKVAPDQTQPLKNDEPIADIFAKIYNLMRKDYARYLLDFRKQKKQHKELEVIKEKRISELIELFGGKYRPKHKNINISRQTKTGKKNLLSSIIKYGIVFAVGVSIVKNAVAKMLPAVPSFSDFLKNSLGMGTISGVEGSSKFVASDFAQDPEFMSKVNAYAQEKNIKASDLLSVMAAESGLDPSKVNPNGGATGLIQFMPKTAVSLGTTTEALRKMSRSEQFEYVKKYFESVGLQKGSTIGDIYAKVYLPARSNMEILSVRGEDYYEQNKAYFDPENKGYITKTDLAKLGERKKQEYNIKDIGPEEVAKEKPLPNKVSMGAPKNVPIPVAMNGTVGTQRGLTVLNKITNVNNGADIYAMEDPGTYISPFLDKQYNYKV